MPVSPSEDEADDQFLRDPEDLAGLLDDLEAEAEPEAPQAGEPGEAGAEEPGDAGETGPDDVVETRQTGPDDVADTHETGPEEVRDTLETGPDDVVDRDTRETGPEEIGGDGGGDRTVDRPGRGREGLHEMKTPTAGWGSRDGAADEPGPEPEGFWGFGFTPAAGERGLEAKLLLLERMTEDGL